MRVWMIYLHLLLSFLLGACMMHQMAAVVMQSVGWPMWAAYVIAVPMALAFAFLVTNIVVGFVFVVVNKVQKGNFDGKRA